MGIDTVIGICVLALVAADLVITILKRNRQSDAKFMTDAVNQIKEHQYQLSAALKNDILNEIRASKTETAASVQLTMKSVSEMLSENQTKSFDMQDKHINELSRSLGDKNDILQKTVGERLTQVDERFKAFTLQNEQSLENVRTAVRNSLASLQEDNSKQLEKMRETVDEKLQTTLNERITQSFRIVNERLQEVYAGLGEMKTLASGVGDLKKVLSNVKTRGIMGELQLGAILEEILPKEQYEENIITKRSTQNRVEYAIKLPGDGENSVYLPIDAKFPADIYNTLVDAYDSGNPDLINAASAALELRIKGCAKDIHDKYVDPPNTTDFAIMFLPFEGLYAEVIRKGLIETLQHTYKVNIAGPTTMAALLNSLQMGFKTLAIQKRSGEVWSVLGAVKTEFGNFTTVLTSAQKRLEQTSQELDKLVGVRTRKINQKLSEVAALPVPETENLFLAVTEEEDTE